VKVGLEEDEGMEDLMINAIGNSVTKNKAYHIIDGLRDESIISEREGDVIRAAIGDRALYSEEINNKNRFRADILRNILLILVK